MFWMLTTHIFLWLIHINKSPNRYNPQLCLTATEHKLTQLCIKHFISRKMDLFLKQASLLTCHYSSSSSDRISLGNSVPCQPIQGAIEHLWAVQCVCSSPSMVAALCSSVVPCSRCWAGFLNAILACFSQFTGVVCSFKRGSSHC